MVMAQRTNERITMLVTFNVKDGQQEAFKAALIGDKNGALAEKGNVSMELYQHRDKPNTFYLFERWKNQKVLDGHFQKPYIKKVLELNKTALTSPLEILYLNDIAPLPKTEIKGPTVNDTPITLICIFKVKNGMQETFVNQFQKSVANSRPEAGNIDFFFHTVPSDNTTFILYERWRNQSALDYHFEQPYTKELFDMFTRTLPEPAANYLNYVVEIK